VTWRERRQLHRALARRVLAGESKTAITGQAATDGEDWQSIARMLAEIPTPASRRRYRWLNRALMALLALEAVGEVAARLALPRTWGWWVVCVVVPACYFYALWRVSRFDGYSVTVTLALLRLLYWTYDVAISHRDVFLAALVTAQVVGSFVLLVLALVTWRRMLPQTRWWTREPRTDASGTVVFEE
jgi:hypothetical protein